MTVSNAKTTERGTEQQQLGGTKCARGEVGVTVRRVIVKIEVTL